MKKHLFQILTVSLILSSLFSCSKPSRGTYLIDNPTNENITVSVDDAEYVVPANSGLDVEIEYGRHILKYNGQSITIFVKNSADKRVIVNPTLSNYVIYSQLYVTDDASEEEFNSFYESFIKINGDSIDLKIGDDTTRLFAPIKVYNDLFIEATENGWDYAINEELPDAASIFTDTGKHFQTSKKKIFREKDFWDFFNDGKFKDSSFEIIIDKIAYKDIPRFDPVPSNLKDVQGEKYQKFLQNYVDSYYDWFGSTGSDTFGGPKDFDVVSETSDFAKLKVEYRQVYPNDASFTDACYEYFNQVVSTKYRFNFLTLD